MMIYREKKRKDLSLAPQRYTGISCNIRPSLLSPPLFDRDPVKVWSAMHTPVPYSQATKAQIKVLSVSCDLDIGAGSGFHGDIMFTFSRITDSTYALTIQSEIYGVYIIIHRRKACPMTSYNLAFQ